MKKNSLVFIAGLSPLIPCSSRFGYGLLIALEVWFLFFASILANKVSEMLAVKKSSFAFNLLFVVACASLYSVIVSALFPIAEFTRRFYIFFTSFSYILFLCVTDYRENYQSFSLISFYSVFIILFSLLRELLLQGSLSFLIPTGFFVFRLIPEKLLIFTFLGSQIGTFFLLAIIVWIYFSIKKSKLISFMES